MAELYAKYFLQNPALQTALPPFLLAFVLTGLTRLSQPAGPGPRLAGTAVGLGVLLEYALALGAPPWPPAGMVDRLGLGLLGLVLIGLAVDLGLAAPRLVARAAVVATTAGALWLVWPAAAAGDSGALAQVAAITVAGWVAMPRLAFAASAEAGAAVVVAALALAALALDGGSAALAQLAGAVAAATGGFALWNWPRQRCPFAAGALLGGGGALLLIAVAAARTGESAPAALLLVPLCLLAPSIVAGAPLGRATMAGLLRPVLAGAVAAIPALAAYGLARLLAGDGPYP